MAEDTVIGKWGTVEFALPDLLENVRDAVNDFAELLIAFLEVANVALEFAKAFLKSYIDPLVSLIEAIIAEITDILEDLKGIGLYITGDWNLLAWPPEDLRGGFSDYERRMIARMTDRTDPTRPNVSSATKALGFFGYISVDPNEYERLIDFILGIMKMFGVSFFPDSSGFPVPVIKDVLYGADSASVFNFGSLLDTLDPTQTNAIPTKVRVTWIATPASDKHPVNPLPSLGPKGFLVTVSTLKEGIHLKYMRVRSNTDMKETGGGKKVQPREYGKVLSKQSIPIVLHGGAEMLSIIGSEFEYNANIDQEKAAPRDGTTSVFGLVDPASNEIIVLEKLGDANVVGTPGDGKGSEFFLQRTFLIEDDHALAQWFAGEYSAVLNLEDMPHAARFEKAPDNQFKLLDDGLATTYFVRAWSVGGQVADRSKTPQWDLTNDQAENNAYKSGQPFIIDMKAGGAQVGAPSGPRKLTFPDHSTQLYLQSVKTALLVLVLSRPDLPLLAEITEAKTQDIADKYTAGKWLAPALATASTGLESSKDLFKELEIDIAKMSAPNQSPMAWRTDLYRRIERVAMNLYERTGPMPAAEAAVVEQTKDLRGLTWSDVLDAQDDRLAGYWRDALLSAGIAEGNEPTILEAFNPNNPAAGIIDAGCCPNIYSAGIPATDVDELFFHSSALLARDSDFYVWEPEPHEVVTKIVGVASRARISALLESVPEGLRVQYRKYITKKETSFIGDAPDGPFARISIVPGSVLEVPEDARQMMQDLVRVRTLSSGDFTPVFMVGRSKLIDLNQYSTLFDFQDEGFVGPPEQPTAGVVYTRGALRSASTISAGGTGSQVIFSQASLALQVASAAMTRPPEDGEWIALRLFDAWPELEDFLTGMENWVKALASAIKSVSDTIIKYIEFVQAQIIEIQQLIRRLNAMIQSLLSFAFALPKFSGLMLLSDGTDGVMADFAAADQKPSDSPLSYGGGIALVIPFAPKFIFDIIDIIEDDEAGSTAVSRPPPAIGVEAVQPAAGPPPTDEPDVL